MLSIDVFDTVLFRRIHPDLIVTGTARELERYLRARGIEPACDVAAERGNAFDEIAAVCQARGGDCEAPLRETLQRWIERVAGRTVPDLESLVSALEQFEVDSEQRASQTNAVVVEWIARERARGRRIVFCSDMYLGSVLLFRLLQAGGCAHLFDAGYVSADVGLTKASGRLFGHVLQREGIGSERIVHVGDSLAADGHGAARAHIRAIVVRDRDRRRRSAVALSDRIAYSESTDWAGIVIAAYADPGSPASTVEESVGRTVIGPAVAAAAHSIADQCRARGVRHVYFLSREGLLLKAAFDRLRPQVWRSGGAPRASYACLSRFTTLLAATRGLGPYELSAALTNHPFATLQRLLAPLGVPPDVLERCGGRCGIAASDAPLPAWFRDWPPFLRVLDCAEVKQHVERASREAHDRLAGYLMQQNFFAGGRVAIVDVGWGGLMQENLHRAFGCQPGFPEIIGFYLGVDEYGRGRRSDARQLVGYSASLRRRAGRAAPRCSSRRASKYCSGHRMARPSGMSPPEPEQWSHGSATTIRDPPSGPMNRGWLSCTTRPSITCSVTPNVRACSISAATRQCRSHGRASTGSCAIPPCQRQGSCSR